MKIMTNFKKALLALPIALFALVALFLFNANATARTQYQDGGTGTTKTPVFNEFYDVPGVGDEADFVRVKTKAGSVDSYKDVLTDACAPGSVFTVRTYVHNGADPDYNTGAGEAIARNTVVAMNVNAFNSVKKDFVFTSKITASNAASMTDTATLKCGNGVVMKLVPSSVQTYSKPLGFKTVSDNAVNGTLKIGSRTQGSGDVYACWDDRVIVVYDVVIEKAPELAPAVCEALEAVVLGSKQVRVTDVKYTENDATVNNIVLNYGDGKSDTVTKAQLPKVHTYDNAGDYTMTATLNTTFDGQNKQVTSDNCKKKITVTEEKVPFYACESFNLSMNKRKATVTFTVTSGNGASFKDATIVYSADGSAKETDTTNQVDDNGKVTSTYTFATGDKNVSANATVRFTVGDEVKEVTCSGKAVLGVQTEKPKELPKTGAGSIAGIMAAVTVAGSALHRRMTIRRNR